jgi:hypothetical protein
MIYAVPLELAGRELTLEFNSRAYMAMHEYTGIDLLGEWEPEDLSTKDIPCFLLAGAITHHPDLGFDWCMDNLRGRDMTRVLKALFDAYKRSMPEPDPEAKTNPPKPVT